MYNIFISFREIDRDNREGFEGMLKNPTSPLRANPISSRNDVRNRGKGVVMGEIKRLMKMSDIVIFLIGNDSHNSEWIDYEIQLALTWHYPYIVVRIPNTSGGFPVPLKNQEFEEISSNPIMIKQNLDALLRN